jgi:TonB family protein
MRVVAGLGLLLVPLAALAAEPVTFRAEAMVSVDAGGKPTQIAVSPDLPAPVREFVERRIASWHFSPPTRGGVVADGVTYLALGACALPTGNGDYRLAVDFRGNGPKRETSTIPYYPAEERRAGKEASLVARIVVETDGSATLQAIEYTDGIGGRRGQFDAAVRDWVKSLHYLPEQLDGKPVRTQLEIPVEFKLTARSRGQMRHELQSRAWGTPACRMAASDTGNLEPVAMDSPIQILPAG